MFDTLLNCWIPVLVQIRKYELTTLGFSLLAFLKHGNIKSVQKMCLLNKLVSMLTLKLEIKFLV